MKKNVLLILFSLLLTIGFSMRLDPSDSATTKMFDSVIVIENELDSVAEMGSDEMAETANQNGTWFMYGFLALGAVLVILKLRGKL